MALKHKQAQSKHGISSSPLASKALRWLSFGTNLGFVFFFSLFISYKAHFHHFFSLSNCAQSPPPHFEFMTSSLLLLCMYVFNPLSPTNVVYMYTHRRLTTYNYINYQETCPLRKLTLSQETVISYSSSLRGEALWRSHLHSHWQVDCDCHYVGLGKTAGLLRVQREQLLCCVYKTLSRSWCPGPLVVTTFALPSSTMFYKS